ncbi:hypothetical protein [Tropicibacter naphthalenivorans]|uniref:Uncharacterized protein n=1 Tax=Tropicibacter naphthalenivorans TaxID=441103 RepID=A0A0P1H0X5_9RHOB|nr:hypothetical protein [Tropicibacter naphthalenivorans]CUH81495.1 hypothetical protein TRN7648_03498 [Tropicibacter naphthalenivorans]SMD00148.1 hypothetical protein SAMN04488093_10992 [Tropicibacter naphthalenivorans]
MSDPVTNVEIEDVLSSIRRLVSEDSRPRPAAKPAQPDRLVLTPSLRVQDAPVPEVEKGSGPEAAADTAATSAEVADGPMLLTDPDPDSISSPDEETSVDAGPLDLGALQAELQAELARDAADRDDPVADVHVAEIEVAEVMEAQEPSADDAEAASDQDFADLLAEVAVAEEDAPVEAKPSAVGILSSLIEEELARFREAAKANAVEEAEEPTEAELSEPDPEHVQPEEAQEEAPQEPQAEPDQDWDAPQPEQAWAEPQQEAEEDEEDAPVDLAQAERDFDLGDTHADETELLEALGEALAGPETPVAEVPRDVKGESLEDKIAALEELVGRKQDDWDIEADAEAPATFIRRAPEPLAWEDHTPDVDEVRETLTAPMQELDDIEASYDEPAVAEPQVQALSLDLDDEALRAMVSQIIRQELQGALGERITRNVRKLVRREIHRVLMSQDYD